MTKINDFSQYAALRADAVAGRETALREVAEQFEALFVQNMLKSMRDASFGDALFGETGGLYRDMFDQQVAADIAAGPGIGFADMLVRQLGGDRTAAPAGDDLKL
ncbi:MAG: rod-binding protein, partial [Pseudomonadota bacterium]